MTSEFLCSTTQPSPAQTSSSPSEYTKLPSLNPEQLGQQQEMLAHVRQTAPGLISRIQSGLSKLPVELIWAAHTQWPLSPSHIPADSPATSARRHQSPIRISVLDSSFNPPTLAHLALVNSPRPSYTTEPIGTDYDAKLLLLSVKNADKVLKPGDATYLQRLQMMGLLAHDVSCQDGNVAIAITDEPTFVGKSKVLQEYLRTRLRLLFTEDAQGASLHAQLSFIVGLDTLERLFSPKYYPPPPGSSATPEETMVAALSRMLSPQSDGGDDSLIVCARRTATLPCDGRQQQNSALELELGEKEGWMKQGLAASALGHASLDLGSEQPAPPRPVQESHSVPKDERVVLIDIGDRASKFSSTAVRNARNRIGTVGSDIGGGPWRDWVTASVATFVEEEELYIS